MTAPLSDDALYAALLARDPAHDGRAFVGVRTTGIFCRLTCPARKPKRENAVFFDSPAACLEAGFRPCLRCRPLASGKTQDPMVRKLIEVLEGDPARRWREEDLAALGYDPSTVRRAFKRDYGTTFLALSRLTRLRAGAEARAKGRPVIDAQLDAGFDSASGFRSAFAKLLGRAPGAFTGREALMADFVDTPLGPMIAVSDEAALQLLEFADQPALRPRLSALMNETGEAIGLGRHAPTNEVEKELGAYFGGRSPALSVPIAPRGTAFSRSVWTALREIPPGETRSYADLAKAIGRPTAVRAVARANGSNRLALVIPCHRVIGADGGLAGYAGGVWRKAWLIEHERRWFA